MKRTDWLWVAWMALQFAAVLALLALWGIALLEYACGSGIDGRIGC